MVNEGTLRTITAAELGAHWRAGRPIELIDVRTPIEYRAVHAELARSIPLDRLDPTNVVQCRDKCSNEPLYLICKSGARSRQAAERFLRAGYANVVCVEGGTVAWEQAGLSVVRENRVISLERQVRIAAGTLVVIGTGLGAFVHPAFLGIAAFVGAGLAFAGITDTCGMGLVLARMPWNNEATSSAQCATEGSRS